MHAMQYRITLPADYDMGIIRRRVSKRGSALDDFHGLGLKAYLIREKGGGSAVNEYAPFYLWNDSTAMSRFLWQGGGFEGIVDSFGRPSVRHWVGAALFEGHSRQSPPQRATVRRSRLAEHLHPQPLVRAAIDEGLALTQNPSLHSVALCVDPGSWEILRFALWCDAPSETWPGETHYQVLHLSQPEIAMLAWTPAAVH